VKICKLKTNFFGMNRPRQGFGRRALSLMLFAVIALGLFVPMERAHAASENRFAGQGLNDPSFVIAWTNVGNILSDNNSDANSSGGFDSDQIHSYLRSRNYGFTIPAGETILGSQVQVEIWDGNATLDMDDNNAKLVKADMLVGADRSMATVWPSGRTVRTYGSPTDLWGTTWTPAEVNPRGLPLSERAFFRQCNVRARYDHEIEC